MTRSLRITHTSISSSAAPPLPFASALPLSFSAEGGEEEEEEEENLYEDDAFAPLIDDDAMGFLILCILARSQDSDRFRD